MKVMIGLAPLVLAACAATATPDAAEIKHLSNPEFEAAGYPFSEAVEVDGWIYISGAIGVAPGSTELAPGGVEGQARVAMDNIKSTLERMDLSMDRVVKCTVMLEDMADWPAFNAVYRTYFSAPYPARSAFGADGLALGGKLEVECIAHR